MTVATQRLTLAHYLQYTDGSDRRYEISGWRMSPYELGYGTIWQSDELD